MGAARGSAWFVFWTIMALNIAGQAFSLDATARAHKHKERHGKHVRHASKQHVTTLKPTQTHQVTEGNTEMGDNSRLLPPSEIIRQHVKNQSPSEIMNAVKRVKWEKDYYEYEDITEDNYDNPDVESSNYELVSDQEYYYNLPANMESSTQTASTTEPGLTQMVYRERMRAKYRRMFAIQAHILWGLGFKEQPNVTGINISNRDGLAIEKYMDPTNNEDMGDSVKAHRYVFASPSCDLPPKANKAWWNPKYFRLYFTPEKLKKHPVTDFEMSSAKLRLFKIAPVEKECDCRKIRPDKQVKTNGGEHGHRRNGRKGLTHRSGGGPASRDRARRKADSAAKKKKNSSKHMKAHANYHVSPGATKEKEQVRVTVYWFQRPVKATRKNRKIKKQLMTSQMIDREYTGWVELDIQQHVQRWIRRPRKNYGIEIYVEDEQQMAVDPFEVFDSVNCSKNIKEESIYLNLTTIDETRLNEALHEGAINITLPNLEMVYMEIPRKVERKKRQVSQTCVKENTFISFSELGLEDWILAPQGLETAYCRGHCRSDVLTDLKHENDVNKKCCGPTKFKPFRFLHYVENRKLSVSSVDNLIVSECGCRE